MSSLLINPLLNLTPEEFVGNSTIYGGERYVQVGWENACYQRKYTLLIFRKKLLFSPRIIEIMVHMFQFLRSL